MWFPLFVASLQLVPFMAMRVIPNQSKLLQEVAVEEQDGPEQAVEKAQKEFAKLNQRFESKLRRIGEARTQGKQVSAMESEEVEKAHKAADEAHGALDMAVAALKARGEAQLKLTGARKHFAVVDTSFKKMMEKEQLAKKLNVDLPALDSEALAAAHQAAIDAQKSVNQTSAVVRELEQNDDEEP
eukprot:CAMPEP_0194485532 /NCGR_PEP_ID=MMETSP0253-20130528/6516_1 /TAXON_ID=2966 /ORGANISM="Noctiluca scintillans" /LENGTH=184 /DNA_ID=CAMNT_0039325529 /DNA_START=18 /DNA_END=572 /DNA_ORIENTATION=+